MSIKDHPKFDASGFYKINDNHLMVFLHSDGFTERLLNIDIFVTKSLKLEIYLSCFKKGNNYEGLKYENNTDEVPGKIISFLDSLVQIESLDFGCNKIDEDIWKTLKDK